MKKINTLVVAGLVACFFSLGLMYGVNSYAEGKNPCSADIAKFCKTIRPGSIALMICLEEHENDLSTSCKDYEAKMGGPKAERREKVAKIVKFRNACASDMGKICKDAKPEPGGMLNCLKLHESQLSAPCSESIKEVGM